MKYYSILIRLNMLKRLLLLFFLIFFTFQISYTFEWKTNDWQTKRGGIISNNFKDNKKMSFPLEAGEWRVVAKIKEDIYGDIFSEERLLLQFENNIPVRYFFIGKIDNLGKWIAYISTYIQAETFNSKNAVCRMKKHYNFLKFYKKGMAHNCMYVTITDVKRELDDYEITTNYTAALRKWIRDEKVKLPEIYLEYSASFHAMTVLPAWYVISYGETPEKFANYKPKFTSRDSTEFHPANINNYPKAKKIMKDWVKKSAKIQKDFEDFLKVKDYQKLELDNIIPRSTKSNIKVNNSISSEIIKLNNLYTSGVITKEEFEKAKAKILK